MKYWQLFALLSAIYVAPLVPNWVGALFGGALAVFMLLAMMNGQ